MFVMLEAVAFWHLWPRRFYIVRDPEVLWSTYWSGPVTEIKHAMTDHAAAVYARNDRLRRTKEKTLQLVLLLAGLEIACVGSAIIWTAAS
jgi:hypothetical protein